ncbi:MAG: YegS/Rv2252/BmrU family lipid kinase [Caldilineaceae bacterium]|nr:YegS/Rv2252/BmrU family lipid kinase [Caldilineaceae bacterium]
MIILNPYAGRGRGASVSTEIQEAFRQGKVPFELAETNAQDGAALLAKQARQEGFKIIAAVGGDGTINEVVNGIADATPEDETVRGLAVLPVGSGNDFADMVGAARSFDAAVNAIREGNTRRVDLGLVEAQGDGKSFRRFFDNNLGIGFEAQVTVESRQIKRLRGFAIYVWAALRALRAYDQPKFELEWTDGNGTTHTESKPLLLISIGNSQRTGGAFYLTPDAVMDDGLLDMAFADAQSKIGILNLMPRAMTKTGLYSQKSVYFSRLRSICVAAEQPVPVHTDGEILSQAIDKLSITVQPGRLQVIV